MIYMAHGTIISKSAPRQYIRDIDGFFDGYVEDAWLNNEFAKTVMYSIDKSKLIIHTLIDHPLFGKVTSEWLSDGTKALIMMNSVQDVVYDGDSLGDDCWGFLLELGKTKDIMISLSYRPTFKWITGCKVLNLDNGRLLTSFDAFLDDYNKSKHTDKEREFTDIAWPTEINTERFKSEEIAF